MKAACQMPSPNNYFFICFSLWFVRPGLDDQRFREEKRSEKW
jgi:hypothetical protein